MEFYMADGELLCQYPDGSVKPVTDSDTDFIREMVATIRSGIREHTMPYRNVTAEV